MRFEQVCLDLQMQLYRLSRTAAAQTCTTSPRRAKETARKLRKQPTSRKVCVV